MCCVIHTLHRDGEISFGSDRGSAILFQQRLITMCGFVKVSTGRQAPERFRGFDGKGKGKVGLPFRTPSSHRQQVQVPQGPQTSDGSQGLGKQAVTHANRAGVPESSHKVLYSLV